MAALVVRVTKGNRKQRRKSASRDERGNLSGGMIEQEGAEMSCQQGQEGVLGLSPSSFPPFMYDKTFEAHYTDTDRDRREGWGEGEESNMCVK